MGKFLNYQYDINTATGTVKFTDKTPIPPKTKEVEFSVQCYLSDAPLIRAWLKSQLGDESILEEQHLQREITDPEVPVGFILSGIFEV